MKLFNNSGSFHLFFTANKLFAGLRGFCVVSAVFIFLFGISGCETPEKVMKSNDVNYKKAKAIFWYNKKEYFKCIPVLEELIGLMKGRESVEELYYMYCMANYEQGDYLISAYHFKNFYDQYPNSAQAEECLYMYAKSNEKQSPKPDLDQTFTYKAIDAFQFFLNMFPDSKYVAESNSAIHNLRRKLEKKALNNAEMYYRTENYKAAATTFENLLIDFPDIEENERISFMIVKSNFLFAENSVPQRKMERYKHVIESFNEFKYKFADSKYIGEANKYEERAHYLAVKSAYEWAEIAPLNEREGQYRVAFAEAEAQKPTLTDPEQLKNLEIWREKGYFFIVKGYFLMSEESKEAQKMSALQQTLKTYYTFVDLFPQSKYAKEAEKIFNHATEQIQRIKDQAAKQQEETKK